MLTCRVESLVFPATSSPNPPNNIHQRKQDRHFDQGPNSRRKGLITVLTERSDGNSNRELEVIAGSGETLCGGQLVSKAKFVCDEQGKEENDAEIDDQGCGDSYNRDDLVHDLTTLGSKQYKDGEEKTDEGPWTDPLKEYIVVETGTGEFAKGETGEDCSP